jgi:hypothetical protein
MIRLTDSNFISLKLRFYVAMAAVIAFVVWAIMDAPSPSHPDSRVAKASSTLKQHTLILLAPICIAVLGFQVYVVTYALTHNDEDRAWLPSICASATILRSVCTDTVLLAVAFDIMSDKTFPIDTPAARERCRKSQQAPEQKSTN